LQSSTVLGVDFSDCIGCEKSTLLAIFARYFCPLFLPVIFARYFCPTALGG
jgi:hypothetical protein